MNICCKIVHSACCVTFLVAPCLQHSLSIFDGSNNVYDIGWQFEILLCNAARVGVAKFFSTEKFNIDYVLLVNAS